jgi:hypothetical protein
MDNPQQHEMILDENHPSGAQNWYCPTCGQSLLVTWTPRFMTVIRKAGNKSALHTLRDYPQAGQSPDNQISLEEPETLLEKARLAPWIAWMEAVGFEKFWNKNVE